MKLLCLGAGNMASALLGPVVDQFECFDVYSPGKSASVFSQKFQANLINDFSHLQDSYDVIVLAFKPQMFNEASRGFLAAINGIGDALVVSMLAGTPLAVIQGRFESSNIVRIMPNTPSLVGHGVSLFLPHGDSIKSKVDHFKLILAKTGEVIQASNELQFDQWTATTGSGPAYLFEIARIMESILLDQNMDKIRAQTAIQELFLGCALMMKNGSSTFEELRQNVTSKKGVTFEALEVFANKNIEGIFKDAIAANINRSSELKEEALKKENL